MLTLLLALVCLSLYLSAGGSVADKLPKEFKSFWTTASERAVSSAERIKESVAAAQRQTVSRQSVAKDSPQRQNDDDVTPRTPQKGWSTAGYALPSGSDTAYTLVNDNGRYVMNYDPDTRNPRWVAYILTRKEVGTKGAERSSSFVTDKRIVEHKWDYATTADYTHSGYDRGHLIPSADRDDTPLENKATFLMSNISPQRPGLNRYGWKYLEEKVRRWALEHDSLYVVTAGVLEERDGRPLKTIGSGVAVPELFFKAVAVRDEGRFQAIGFVMPNIDDCNRDYTVYAVPADSIERLTGLDLFYMMPSEPVYDKSFWF